MPKKFKYRISMGIRGALAGAFLVLAACGGGGGGGGGKALPKSPADRPQPKSQPQ